MTGGGEGRRVAVVGAGSWGTALALLLDGKGHEVQLWSYESAVAEEIRERRENVAYLPGAHLPDSLSVTSSLEEVADGADLVVSVSPSQHVGRVMEEILPYLPSDAQILSASKGIETPSLRRMSEVFEELLPPDRMERFTVLSGPSFAAEVARGVPTAVAVASRSEPARLAAQAAFQTDRFRVYTNDDVTGVELGGSLKNVIALAAGVAAGLGFGHNTLAALITRGLAEITRLGVAMGARKSTFSGLAGLGDLVLTCTGELSRNRTVGYRLGQGESLSEVLGGMRAVAEGVRTARAVRELALRHRVETPISSEVHAILEGERSPREAVQNLMLRDPKPEEWA